MERHRLKPRAWTRLAAPSTAVCRAPWSAASSDARRAPSAVHTNAAPSTAACTVRAPRALTRPRKGPICAARRYIASVARALRPGGARH